MDIFRGMDGNLFLVNTDFTSLQSVYKSVLLSNNPIKHHPSALSRLLANLKQIFDFLKQGAVSDTSVMKMFLLSVSVKNDDCARDFLGLADDHNFGVEGRPGVAGKLHE